MEYKHLTTKNGSLSMLIATSGRDEILIAEAIEKFASSRLQSSIKDWRKNSPKWGTEANIAASHDTTCDIGWWVDLARALKLLGAGDDDARASLLGEILSAQVTCALREAKQIVKLIEECRQE
jgi:hypothetical protein